MIVDDLSPTYYAVIFTALLVEDSKEYKKTAKRMELLAKKQNGFLGIESARNEVGITVSYWKDLASISNWKNNVEHTEARKLGKEKWYKQYQLRICKVEREYGFKK